MQQLQASEQWRRLIMTDWMTAVKVRKMPRFMFSSGWLQWCSSSWRFLIGAFASSAVVVALPKRMPAQYHSFALSVSVGFRREIWRVWAFARTACCCCLCCYWRLADSGKLSWVNDTLYSKPCDALCSSLILIPVVTSHSLWMFISEEALCVLLPTLDTVLPLLSLSHSHFLPSNVYVFSNCLSIAVAVCA